MCGKTYTSIRIKMQQALWSMKICIKNAFQRIGTVELNYSIVVSTKFAKLASVWEGIISQNPRKPRWY